MFEELGIAEEDALASALPAAALSSPGYDDPNDLDNVPADIRKSYEVHTWRNGATLLRHACPEEFSDVMDVLRSFRLARTYILKDKESNSAEDLVEARGGGNKSLISKAIDSGLYRRGWAETRFDTTITVKSFVRRGNQRLKGAADPNKSGILSNVVEYIAPTHNVDCFKNGVAFEIEWNNKDPFFDRDLNNFRLLFDLRMVSVGVIVTRSSSLRAFLSQFMPKSTATRKYGRNTTHMEKLEALLQGGNGGGCPVLAFGITEALYDSTR
ncbi:MAG TPA: BglII/BstYI family type II restriction endonuclease [Candidatus Baltobacteraceae bacterium]|nr:BglII/BstYI family type II restriction endonuclease [Candidatus Baltobacteraceae bacterium]